MTDSDAIATATTANYLAEIGQARERWIADQLSRLPADRRPTAEVWLRIHGILPPWAADLLVPEHATEPGS